MKTRLLIFASAVLCAAMMSGATVHADGAAAGAAQRPQQDRYEAEVRAGAEGIYVARTTRTRHTSGATPACGKAPFASADEDYYALWSVGVRARDSRIVDTRKDLVGGFAACFSQLVRGRPVEMYAAGTVAHVPWTGTGECMVLRSQPPVKTVVAFHCLLDLSGLPGEYSGGFVVSSTVQPFLKGQPPTAYVPGYLSTSVVIFRLWKMPADK